jgi:hypothetical protein
MDGWQAAAAHSRPALHGLGRQGAGRDGPHDPAGALGRRTCRDHRAEVEYGGLGLTAATKRSSARRPCPIASPGTWATITTSSFPSCSPTPARNRSNAGFPPCCDGDHIWAQMTIEPSGGSDLFGLITRAEQREGKVAHQRIEDLDHRRRGFRHGPVPCPHRPEPAQARGPDHVHGRDASAGDDRAPADAGQRHAAISARSSWTMSRLSEDIIVGEVNGGWAVASTQLAAERAATSRGWYIGVGASLPRETDRDRRCEPIRLARDLGVAESQRARTDRGRSDRARSPARTGRPARRQGRRCGHPAADGRAASPAWPLRRSTSG